MWNFEIFLNNYQILINKNKPTFFKITGFPRWENVWSNVINFYLNNEFHGMNGFLLNCIKECIGLVDLSTTNVISKREVFTNQQNKIAIFVETDNYCFFIENKVDAILSNDLDDYLKYTKETAENKGIGHFGIVLSRVKKPRDGGIFYLSYNILLTVIRKQINQILFSSDNRYLMFFIEFIENISNVMEGKMDLNEEFYNQYIIHEEKIKNIHENYKSLLLYRRDIVIKYTQSLKEKYRTKFSKIFPWEDYIVGMEIYLPENVLIVIDIVFYLNGVTLNIKSRESSIGIMDRIKTLLGEYIIDFYAENGILVGKEKYKLNQMENFEKKYFPIIDTFIKNIESKL